MCLNASGVMVRPSEHLSPALVAYPPKSARVAPILTVPSCLYEFVVCGPRRTQHCSELRPCSLQRRSRRRLRHVAVLELVRLRILRWHEPHTLTDFVAGEDFVPSELVSDLCDLLHRNERERVAEEQDGLVLSSSGLRQERPSHRFRDGSENRLERSILVVQHSLFVGRTVHDLFGQTELAIEHLDEVFDLPHQVVFGRTIELSDLFGTIRVGDTVLTAGKLELDVLPALFGLCSTSFRLDHIRQLNDHVELAGTRRFIHRVQHVEFPNQSLQRRVRFVHDRVERVLDDRTNLIRERDLFSDTTSVVVDTDADFIGKASYDRAGSKGLDVVPAGIQRTQRRVDRDYCRTTSIEKKRTRDMVACRHWGWTTDT